MKKKEFIYYFQYLSDNLERRGYAAGLVLVSQKSSSLLWPDFLNLHN